MPKRFANQMYLYFLEQDELPGDRPGVAGMTGNDRGDEVMKGLTSNKVSALPSADGGAEIQEAEFAPAGEWMQRAREGKIILYPPQFLLLHILAEYLDNTAISARHLNLARRQLTKFAGLFGPKIISPVGIMFNKSDGRAVLGLDKPGPELAGTPHFGDLERVVLAKFEKGVPRDVEVRWREEVLDEKRRQVEEERNTAKI
ncbi:MAG: hypothetical protein Q9227_000040 [Pyrenula ochraceoflavens]